jgi:hypothetical protein
MFRLRHWAIVVGLLATLSRADTVPAADVATYPDDAGFEARSAVVLEGLRLNTDLGVWRRGYFSGGDPGKYVPSVVYARLRANPADADAIAIMNDDRSFKEHYHFAALNWARFYPLMADQVLTAETRRKFAEASFRYNYLNPTGTENHKTMSMTSANVLPWYTDRGLSHQSKQETLAAAKEQLRTYVKGLYQSGQGEWDSSTYWAFTMNGMLNIHDFSQDPECRKIARAALDWFAATYALKYRDGLFCGPNQRGHYSKPHESIADRVGYLWFGSDSDVTANDMRRAHHTIESITSRYRPPEVIFNIARKELSGLPVRCNNTKPVYWYGLNIYPNPNAYAETVYVARHYSMGTLFNGHGSQITRFQIVADTDAGAVSFTGGHPARSDHNGVAEGFGYADGIGRFESTAQVGPTALCVWSAPDDEAVDHGFFSIPKGIAPTFKDGWAVMVAGRTFVAVRGVNVTVEAGLTRLTEKQISENAKDVAANKPERHTAVPILRLSGRKAGWIVETADTDTFRTEDDFITSLSASKVEWFEPGDGSVGVRYASPQSGDIELVDLPDTTNAGVVRHQGELVDYKSWKPVYDGPFVRQADGVLTITDGQNGFVIDFTGDLPIYKPWTP